MAIEWLRFGGLSGMKPSAEARRYVYGCLAQHIDAALANGDGWLCDDLSEVDGRRARNAAKLVSKELRRKAAAPPTPGRR